MGNIKHEFYRIIGIDFHTRHTESFLYSYFKKEKEGNFRLQLKRKFIKLKENTISTTQYEMFLVTMLLTNMDLKKKYEKIPSLIPFLKTISTVETMENKEQDTTKMCREYLQKAEILLKQETVPAVDISLLTQLTKEICNCYEFKTGRKDLYVQLTDYFLSYKMGELNKNQYLVQLLQILFENKKLHLSKEFRQIILCYGKSLAGEEVFAGIRKEQDILFQMIQILLEKGKADVSLEDATLRKITGEIQDMILQQDINTFLYDVGFVGNGKKPFSSRKKDRSMDMLDAFCEEEGISLFGQQVAVLSETKHPVNEQYMEDCDKLLQLLNDKKRSHVFLPVMIDPATGVGIYIIGKAHFASNMKIQKKMKRSCGYGLVQFTGVDDENGTVFTIDMDVYDISTLKEAKEWLETNTRPEALEQYQDYNKILPKGAPEVFKSYFSTSHLWEKDDFEQEKEETKKWLEKEKRKEQQRIQRENELKKKRRYSETDMF